MAGNALTDGLGFAAAATLGKATGTDFLSPALEDVRARDRFVFQQRQMQAVMDKERKRVQGERLQSQRGLLNSLKAVGAFKEEDFIAVGGVDAIANLDPNDFEVAFSQLRENRLRDLSKEEKRQVITAQAAAHDLVLAPNASDQDILIMEERLAMLRLDQQTRKAEEKEARADAHMRLGATQNSFQELLHDPTQVTEQTVMQLEALIEADARYLGNLQGVDPDDLAVLTQQHQQNQRMTQRARTMAAATNLANGTRGELLTAWAENPDMRTALRGHEQMTDARRAVEQGVTFLTALDDASAEHLGLKGVKELVAKAGGASGVMRNGDLAAQVAAESERIGDYSERLRGREKNRAAETEAGKAASDMRAILGDMMADVDPVSHVKNGVFYAAEFSMAALEPLVAAVPGMDSKQLRETQRRLSRTGLPMSMLAAPLALVDNRLASMVDEYDPVSVIKEQAVADGLRYEAVTEAVKLSPIIETQVRTQRYSNYGLPGVQTEFPVMDLRLNPEWTGAMAQAFDGLDQELNDRQSVLRAEVAKLEAGSAEFSADSVERQRFNGFVAAIAPSLKRIESRIEIRDMLANELGALPLGTDEETATSLFSLGGGKDVDIEGKKRTTAALADGSANSVLVQLEQALRSQAGTLSPEASAALSAEITMLQDVTKRIVPMFEGENAEKVRKELKRQGILKSADTQYPELEVLAYFLGNRF